jgi:hypothetical protein
MPSGFVIDRNNRLSVGEFAGKLTRHLGDVSLTYLSATRGGSWTDISG